jgi:hypothetical protein
MFCCSNCKGKRRCTSNCQLSLSALSINTFDDVLKSDIQSTFAFDFLAKLLSLRDNEEEISYQTMQPSKT